MPRNDPVRNFRFRPEIDGTQAAALSDVAIAATMTESIDYRSVTHPMPARQSCRG